MPESRKYVVASEEGARWASQELGRPVELGEDVELELEKPRQERAVLAAGWFKEKKGAK